MKLIALAVVSIAAAVFAYAAPPLGFILDLSEAEIFICTMVGTALGSVVLVYSASWIYTKLITGFYHMIGKDVPERSAAPEWMLEFVKRYGAPGLGLLGPMTIGGMAAAFLGPVLGISKGKLAFWLAVGSVLFIGAYTLLVLYAFKAA